MESLESECIRKQIKMSLLDEMLRKKPHYAKFFTELEDEMEDRQAFVNMNSRSTNVKSGRERLSSLFRCSKINDSIVDPVASVPRITM